MNVSTDLRYVRRTRATGIFCLGIVLLWNRWTITRLFGFDMSSVIDSIVLWVFDLIMLITGIGFLVRPVQYVPFVKKTAPNVMLVFISFFIMIGVFEAVLRTGILDPEETDLFIWTPSKYTKINQEINARNIAIADQHPFGFVDAVRTEEKPEGIEKRILVLGDSFIWGDGVSYDTIWSHKLEKKATAHDPRVEVISWGRPGWSTKDEFEFFKEHAEQFDIDLVLVGFVTNDPDMGNIRQVYVGGGQVVRRLGQLFPNATAFFTGYLDTILSKKVSGYGYISWQDKLYESENLQAYGSLLNDFASFGREHDIPVAFVFTPNTPHPDFREKYDRITPLLNEAGIPYLDLYPVVAQEFQDVPLRELWANPANAHPGDVVTDIYAREVFHYLTSTAPYIFTQS